MYGKIKKLSIQYLILNRKHGFSWINPSSVQDKKNWPLGMCCAKADLVGPFERRALHDVTKFKFPSQIEMML